MVQVRGGGCIQCLSVNSNNMKWQNCDCNQTRNKSCILFCFKCFYIILCFLLSEKEWCTLASTILLNKNQKIKRISKEPYVFKWVTRGSDCERNPAVCVAGADLPWWTVFAGEFVQFLSVTEESCGGLPASACTEGSDWGFWTCCHPRERPFKQRTHSPG